MSASTSIRFAALRDYLRALLSRADNNTVAASLARVSRQAMHKLIPAPPVAGPQAEVPKT